jgi:hypothetical protein
MECGDAKFDKILDKNNLRCRSRNGHVQFRYSIYYMTNEHTDIFIHVHRSVCTNWVITNNHMHSKCKP